MKITASHDGINMAEAACEEPSFSHYFSIKRT